MNIRPLHDRIVVRRMEEEKTTASGIIIPDSATEKPDRGEILAAGPGKAGDDNELVALQVAVGDQVLFGKYAGTAVKVDGEEVLIMREEDVLAVIES
uniref:Co-chaperonin GroES n=1 Tax=uncultured Thiotrichaceae bacterium TaxID=298394 RepID=A0A6S6U897_9GAMM|nr:MAG: Heat shock protein 60 family co-chaperone GroES [uncultured Thiotrichaceae bacterium]